MPGKIPKDPDLKKMGAALRARREALGISQAEVAGRCGMHATFVAGVERGERNVSYLTLLRIVTALETKIHLVLKNGDL